MKTALVLIDLQNDYLAAPGLRPAGPAVAARAARLLEGCRDLGVPAIFVWTTVSRGDDRRMEHWKRVGRWWCEEGTPGHAPPPTLQPRPGEEVVHKTHFSGFQGQELERSLRAAGCEAVILAGIHLHACVRATALDAYQRGFRVLIATDALASDDPAHAAVTQRAAP